MGKNNWDAPEPLLLIAQFLFAFFTIAVLFQLIFIHEKN